MDIQKLNPILNKEAILKTANAKELATSPNDVLERYNTYALTHVPLGDTTQQLANLERVIVTNKECAVGTIVGPYGYGKTSTAVHLWHEIKNKKIIAVPPFLWKNLDELMDAVYHWIHFEFSQGPKKYITELDQVYKKYRQKHIDQLIEQAGAEIVNQWMDAGILSLKLKPSDVVGFFGDATQICEKAGYKGLVTFTDELQATLASYSSRDEFFADLFDLVKDILGLPGHWALVITMDDGTEGIFARLREDLLQRLQKSALHFRVKNVYNRREYPGELWSAFEKRFNFIGSKVILKETLESIGQVASRSDLGAGPRTVTNAMALAIKHFEKSNQAYSPINFVEDFLTGHVVFDQRGKFGTAVKKALDNPEVRSSKENQHLVKFLSAFPMGCSEKLLDKFDLGVVLHKFPGLARQELIAHLSGGFILRALSEEEIPQEYIEQRLVKEFVSRFSPTKSYASNALDGFIRQVLLESTFAIGWKGLEASQINFNGVGYKFNLLQGTFDPKYPDRTVNLMATTVPQSAPPTFDKAHPDADLEFRFELNYSVAPSEPSRLLISAEKPIVAVFQLNLSSSNPELANKTLPNFLLDYYAPDQFTPLLCLSLADFLIRNQGTSQDDKSRVNAVILPLRQFAFSIMLGESIEVTNSEFASGMVGGERIKELFRQQCRKIFSQYKTLMVDKNWMTYLQYYLHAIEKTGMDDGISIARGRQPWVTTKDNMAGGFGIPGRKLSSLEVAIESLSKAGVLEKVQYSGRVNTSEASLLLKLHPLEEEWLSKLDNSKKHVNHKGNEVPCLPADILMEQSKALGYTLSEINEFIHLMTARKFIDFDNNRKLFLRTIDSVGDLKSSVEAMLVTLEEEVNTLRTAVPDFDDRFYPISKLKTEFTHARERDEFERVRNEVRRLSGSLNGFTGKRFEGLRQSLIKELEEIYNTVRQGVPIWLTGSYAQSPLSEILERQKNSLVASYQGTLDLMQQEKDATFRKHQEITSPTPAGLSQIFSLYKDFSEKTRKFKTKLQGIQDRHDEFEIWSAINKLASDVDLKSKNILQVYQFSEFTDLAGKIWKEIKSEYNTDPTLFSSRQQKIKIQIESLGKRITSWVENRRSEFDSKRKIYQQGLKELDIITDLRIPFDPEHPAESANYLQEQVILLTQTHIDTMETRLSHILVVTKFAIKVQKIDLKNEQARAQKLIAEIPEFRKIVSIENMSNTDEFERSVISPIKKANSAEKDLYQLIRYNLKPGKPRGEEILLFETMKNSNGQMDLRSLITSLLEQGKDDVDLEKLLANIQSLFQKNLVDIRLKILDPKED